jgi:hypothetical protein
VAGHTWDEQRGGSGEEGAREGEQLGDGTLPRPGALDPDQHRRGDGEQGKNELEVEEAASKCGDAQERHHRADVPRRSQRELRGGDEQVERRDEQRRKQRDGKGDRHCAQRAARHALTKRPRDHRTEDEEADRGHRGQEDEPPSREQPRRRGGLADRRDHEPRRRPRVGPDCEREGTAYWVPVGRDDAPEDEVPAFGEPVERYVQLVRVLRRAVWRTGGLLPAACVGHRDDREARLHRLAVRQRDLRWRAVDGHARGRRRAQQRRMRPRGRRQPEPGEQRGGRDGDASSSTAAHVSGRLPPISAISPMIRATPPTTIATIASVELLPPTEETPST